MQQLAERLAPNVREVISNIFVEMSDKEENGDVDASVRLLDGEKKISASGDLDATTRSTKNRETAAKNKQLKIVEKESEYENDYILCTRKWDIRP